MLPALNERDKLLVAVIAVVVLFGICAIWGELDNPLTHISLGLFGWGAIGLARAPR